MRSDLQARLTEGARGVTTAHYKPNTFDIVSGQAHALGHGYDYNYVKRQLWPVDWASSSGKCFEASVSESSRFLSCQAWGQILISFLAR